MHTPESRDTASLPSPAFALGQIVATPGALRLLEAEQQALHTFLVRHQQADWGDVPPEDSTANHEALRCGDRLLSAYVVGTGRIWIITEADRSVTTALLPEEY